MQIVPRERAHVKPGDDFNRLTVIGEPFLVNLNGIRYQCVVLECSCGNVVSCLTGNLKRTQSCGCFNSDVLAARNRTHGERKTRLYRIWTGMLTRCRNPNSQAYSRYGAAGIAVCEEWLSYERFRDWSASSGYRDGLTIDRRNSDDDYSPQTCRWATPVQQQANKRKRAGTRNRYKGVRAESENSWSAWITSHGARHYLGAFRDEESAARAYDAAARLHHGEFAVLNFPESN